MCMRMLGKSHTTPEGREFALSVMQRLNDKCKGMAAGRKYRLFCSIWHAHGIDDIPLLPSSKRFGIIKATDKNYITNSYRPCVTEPIDAFHKLKFEADFQRLSPGSCHQLR